MGSSVDSVAAACAAPSVGGHVRCSEGVIMQGPGAFSIKGRVVAAAGPLEVAAAGALGVLGLFNAGPVTLLLLCLHTILCW